MDFFSWMMGIMAFSFAMANMSEISKLKKDIEALKKEIELLKAGHKANGAWPNSETFKF